MKKGGMGRKGGEWKGRWMACYLRDSGGGKGGGDWDGVGPQLKGMLRDDCCAWLKVREGGLPGGNDIRGSSKRLEKVSCLLTLMLSWRLDSDIYGLLHVCWKEKE